MPKRKLNLEILKILNDFNIEVQSANNSGEDIFTITCNNYMINIVNGDRLNINFHVNCSPLESAKLIQMISKIKNIDMYIGYVYIFTQKGRLLINKKAIEYSNQLKYDELSDQFVKDHYERKFLLSHQAGSC